MDQLPTDWDRALAVVAHPDDLEYGAAGAIAAWTAAGKHVTYLLATRGEAGIDGIPPDECAKLREAEQRASAAIVGVDAVEFLDHHDGVLEEGLPLRRDLVAAIRRHRPELVLTLNHHEKWANGFWNTPDHRALGRSVLDATTCAGNRWIFPDDLEPWNGVRYVAIAGSPMPTHEFDIADTFEAAVQSLAAHAAYIRGLNANEDVDPVTYARDFLTRACGAEEGARPKISFELQPR
jgi:LmbE family N-acetylglucosaminyl deacetylase